MVVYFLKTDEMFINPGSDSEVVTIFKSHDENIVSINTFIPGIIHY